MKISINADRFVQINLLRYFFSIALCCFLCACGGAGAIPQITLPAASATPTASAAADRPADAGFITTVNVQNLGGEQVNVPITFGQIFAVGDLPAQSKLIAKLNSGVELPLQVEIKASHSDGSARHAIISLNLPQLNVFKTEAIHLIKEGSVSYTTPTTPTVTPTALLNAGFSAGVTLTLNQKVYSASADALLRTGKYTQWLAGDIVNEWQVSAPLKSSAGDVHPHLTARFAIRHYRAQNRTRVDVTIENNWAYEPAPQNFVYDAQIQVGGQTVYNKNALNHYHHARWRKIFWWGAEPQFHLIHNTAYLIASKALPNFDQKTIFPSFALTPIRTKFIGTVTEPMGSGLAEPYMPATGGRPDIGLLPGWAVTYLLTMDKDVERATFGTADLAGSWSMHYRDKNTDRPVSLVDYPYMTILGSVSDTLNPVTKKSESFPACGGICTTPNIADSAHEPAFSYLPYLLTGDYYHLEELQFWTMWNLFQSNPGYRSYGKGLFNRTQLRGQAWILRSLAQTTYITPDKDPMKKQLLTFLNNNLDWYNSTYSNNPKSDNTLGAILDGNSTIYNNQRGIAPWQDDFFTSAAGHSAELGFSQAQSLLKWKAKFPIGRMVDPNYCWILGAIYSLNMRDSATSTYYTTFGQAYLASNPPALTALRCASAEMAANLGLKIGEMTGYASEATGFPSNMQPALAFAADSGAAGAREAWNVFNQRSVKPNFASGPQFSIVPRSIK